MRKFDRTQNQRGIGLLELMLAMVIIAILTLMSIQYFSSAKRNTETGKGVDEIQDIIGIVAGMPAPYATATATADTNSLDTSVAMSGQLPQEYVYSSGSSDAATYYIGTPWTDNTTFTKINFKTSMFDANTLQITGNEIPNWACQSLLDRFRSEVVSGDANKVSKCDGSTLTLYFYMKSNQNL
ncbi:MAG: hypothetical protein K0R24_2339 [Gammaproteobacteria bacterium]|jgi:Tfp pilus assembly protein FimT|nr:hypothetical protein [Gammaproteobacteria bacterium]